MATWTQTAQSRKSRRQPARRGCPDTPTVPIQGAASPQLTRAEPGGCNTVGKNEFGAPRQPWQRLLQKTPRAKLVNCSKT